MRSHPGVRNAYDHGFDGSALHASTGPFEVLRRHRWRMVLVAAAVLAGSAAVYPTIPKRYESAALLMLRPTGQEGQVESDRSIRSALDESAIQSEVDILSSRALGAEVARRLRLGADPEFNPARRGPGLMERLRAQLPGRLADALATAPARQRLTTAQEQREVQRQLADQLSVRRDRRSYVLRVGYWSHDAEKAASMSNALVDAFLESQVERKRRLQTNMVDWLGGRVEELGRSLERSEQAVQNYLVASGLVDSSMETSLRAQLATFSSEVALAQSRALDVQSRARTLAELQRAGQIDTAPEVLGSQLVQNLRERIATLGANVGSSSGMGPMAAPERSLNDLRQTVAAEAQRIMRSAQVEANVATQREAALRAEIARVTTELTRRQGAERQLEALRRDATVNRGLLEEATARHRSELGRVGALQPDAEVVARAEPALRSSYPSLVMAAIGSLAMALFAAAASVMLPLLRLRHR